MLNTAQPTARQIGKRLPAGTEGVHQLHAACCDPRIRGRGLGRGGSGLIQSQQSAKRRAPVGPFGPVRPPGFVGATAGVAWRPDRDTQGVRRWQQPLPRLSSRPGLGGHSRHQRAAGTMLCDHGASLPQGSFPTVTPLSTTAPMPDSGSPSPRTAHAPPPDCPNRDFTDHQQPAWPGSPLKAPLRPAHLCSAPPRRARSPRATQRPERLAPGRHA